MKPRGPLRGGQFGTYAKFKIDHRGMAKAVLNPRRLPATLKQIDGLLRARGIHPGSAEFNAALNRDDDPIARHAARAWYLLNSTGQHDVTGQYDSRTLAAFFAGLECAYLFAEPRIRPALERVAKAQDNLRQNDELSVEDYFRLRAKHEKHAALASACGMSDDGLRKWRNRHQIPWP